MLHRGQAHLIIHTHQRAWREHEAKVFAAQAAADEAELRKLIENCKAAQRVDMALRLHLACNEALHMWPASRWDLEAFLDPRKVERRVASFEVEGH